MIKFIRSYRGKVTNEVFFAEGAEAEFDAEIEAYLIEVEAATEVKTTRAKTTKRDA